MIGHCFNPKCNEELRYLRHGSVYQWERALRKTSARNFSGYARPALSYSGWLPTMTVSPRWSLPHARTSGAEGILEFEGC